MWPMSNSKLIGRGMKNKINKGPSKYVWAAMKVRVGKPWISTSRDEIISWQTVNKLKAVLKVYVHCGCQRYTVCAVYSCHCTHYLWKSAVRFWIKGTGRAGGSWWLGAESLNLLAIAWDTGTCLYLSSLVVLPHAYTPNADLLHPCARRFPEFAICHPTCSCCSL